MAPPGGLQDLMHRVRRAHPAGVLARRDLARMEHATSAELRRYQDRRLRLMVRLAAARSPFYRRWFARSGVAPSSIRTLDDMHVLPIVTRDDLLAAPRDFATYPVRVMWESHSSGTSGKAITVYRTPGSSVYEQAALQRQWSWFGLGRDARRFVMRGSDFAADAGAPVLHLPGDHQLLVSSYRLSPETVPGILDAIREFGPDAAEGYPSSMALLASYLRDMGEKLPLKAIITSSEVMTPRQVEVMQAVFDAPIVDHYGQTERVVLAGNCEAGGFHEFSDYGIVERHPVPGRPGRYELVATSLHNLGFPLLRYRTGDEVGEAAAGPCACGRAFPLLGTVDGRVEDSFHAADGRELPLPSIVVDDLSNVAEVQVAQLAPGRFELRAVPADGFDAERLRAYFAHTVERHFGPGQETTMRVFDERIPRPASGKLRPSVIEGRAGSGGTRT
ncbi:MAG: hypothetical protein ABS81_11710 [Pseudonocardia sp. SCN 72-86]|nr:MAG: hypothetical protein ABS81_11710 [Pseudonocardia sp. SCN 72-86]